MRPRGCVAVPARVGRYRARAVRSTCTRRYRTRAAVRAYMCCVLDRVPSEIAFLTYNCIQFGISQERNLGLHTIICKERDLGRNAI